MPTFKLDDRDIPFEKGDTIIMAAWRQGIEIPHYCWHPGLSIAANCRMCLVEILPGPNQRAMMLDILKWDAAKNDYVVDRKPKLQPACQMQVAEGMVVKSDSSPFVKDARAHVQEFLLANHPVDCPICDQAGECKLQDYWMSESGQSKRMRDEPVHKPKAVPFGDKIVYDAERCIACTRCIRTCDELAGDHMLDLRERGNKAEVVLAPGRALEGDYQLMVEHVCPVGALTSSHFRFKARVWTLKETPSVCTGCATGCTTWVDVDPREQRAYRLRPRDNAAVNKFWMCDDGMMTYAGQHEGRVTRAAVGREGGRTRSALDVAITRAAEALKGVKGDHVAVVLSAQHSTEDNFVAVELAKALNGRLYLSAKPAWRDDKILRNADQNPNRSGAVAVASGASVGTLKDLIAAVNASTVNAVIALGGHVDTDPNTLSGLGQLPLVLLASHETALGAQASVILPAATSYECEGSFVNAKGLPQGFRRALRPQGDAAPGWELLSRLGRAMGLDLAYTRFKDVRAALHARVALAHPDHTPAPALSEAPAAATTTA